MSGLRLSTGLGLLQKQKLSQDMQLGFRLLQMSRMDLDEYLQDEVLNNPFLDWETEAPGSQRKLQAGVDFAYSSDAQPDLIAMLEQPEGSMYERLQGQIENSGWPAILRREATRLISELDEHGFLPEVCPFADWTQEQYDDAVLQFQRLEPAGIGARSVTESLLLQSADRGLPEYVDRLIRDHLEDIANGEFERISRVLRLDEEALREAIHMLRSLSPYPANFSNEGPTQYTTPDVVVECRNGVYEVVGAVRTRLSPALQKMEDLTRKGAKMPAEDRKLLNRKKREAQSLLKFCELREETIVQVAKIIVRHQQDFFRDGPKHLHPLGLRDVAEELEVHESTISRAISGKTMLTDRGTIPLRNFFAQRVSDQVDGNTVSAAVQEELKQLMEEEASTRPSKPYSDEEIAQVLASRGMPVARRTVAKYRGILDIPGKGERKRLYRLADFAKS